jgi:hypothetical protein
MLYIKSDTEYAIGFPKALDGFHPVTTEAEGFGSVQARARTFAGDLSASFPIAGTPAVVMGCPELLKKSPEDWVITASHEMFHVFQAANGSYAKIATLEIGSQQDASWQLTFPFSYADAELMRLIHLQGYTLWLSATSKEDEDLKYSAETAVEAAEVYRTFLNRLEKPEDYLYSEFQEWNEGVAAIRSTDWQAPPNRIIFRALHSARYPIQRLQAFVGGDVSESGLCCEACRSSGTGQKCVLSLRYGKGPRSRQGRSDLERAVFSAGNVARRSS